MPPWPVPASVPGLVRSSGEDVADAAAKSPGRQLSDEEDAQKAVAAMDRLPQRQREVLYLHACEELSLAEISEVLDITPGAVKASLSLARQPMRRWVKDLV